MKLNRMISFMFIFFLFYTIHAVCPAAECGDEVAPEGLVSWYPYDEAVDGSTVDYRTGSSAQTINASVSEGVLSNALYFDGSSYVTAPFDTSNNFSGYTPFTISAWIKVDENVNSDGGIVGRWNDTNSWQYLVKYLNSGSKLRFAVSSGNVKTVDSASIPKNEWVKFTAVYNGSSIRLYINGEPSGGSVSVGSVAVNNDIPFITGACYLGRSTRGQLTKRKISYVKRFSVKLGCTLF